MGRPRPCVVNIPEDKEELRLRGEKVCERVLREAETHENVLFHRWHERFWTCGQSVMVGGYSAGQMSCIFGVVEYEDGTVHLVEPEYIRFTDKAVRR